ncbi:MAG: reprolysin-like metallopeptidase [Bacteroidota bacterium]
MRSLFTFIVLALLSSNSFAQEFQNFWSNTNGAELNLPGSMTQEELPHHYKTFKLEYDQMHAALRRAPMEYSRDAESRSFVIELPLPNGQMEPFRVVESPVMMPKLAAKYPMIKTYGGYSLRDETVAMKFTFSPVGLQAIIATPKGLAYINPVASGQTAYYISFYFHDIKHHEPIVCGVGHEPMEVGQHPLKGIHLNKDIREHARVQSRGSDPVQLRTYRMALASTAEFAPWAGNTMQGVMTAMNTAVGQLNLIFEIEAAIRFMLIDDNDKLIYLDGATDPYANPTVGSQLLTPNQQVLDQEVGSENYDVGHVFTGPCSDLAGVAQLASACGTGKGRGVTCFNTTDIIARVNTVMAHEIGHQFGASHSWNNCPGSQEQRAGSTAFEPGSGTTIMSYAGVCADGQNVQVTNDVYFHNGSLEQIYAFSRDGGGNDCPVLTETGNRTPELTMPDVDGLILPYNTPFDLTASATDPDDDEVTYCWEQFDTGPLTPLGEPAGSSPTFRSFRPTTNPTRTFPRIPNIVNNITDDETEVLPTYSRDLKFRCTVRDNQAVGGGVTWEEVSLKVTDASGPFRVTNPNERITLEAGQLYEVNWNVANTDNNTVNCQNVNILLSENGGFNFPHTIATNVPNDGAHVIVVPNILGDDMRIKVEAADNIFFDISNRDFEIVSPATPGLFLDVQPFNQLVCLPATVEMDLNTDSILGFNTPVNYELRGLPAGATANFSANPATPTDNTNLTIDLNNTNTTGETMVELVAYANGLDTLRRTFFLDVVSNDFSALTLDQPVAGDNSVSDIPTFSWPMLDNVESVDIEVASSANFGNTIVTSETGITGTSYTVPVALDKNATYYWRLRPTNRCGTADFTGISAFRTLAQTCEDFTSTAVPVIIPSIGTPTVEIPLTVSLDGTINDLNILEVRGQHDRVRDLEVRVQAPDGKEARLFNGLCGNTQLFNLAFDDQAASDMIPCPPTTGLAYQPLDELSIFNGDNSQGEWKLVVEVIDDFGQGGGVQGFSIQTCSNVTSKNPFLINNDTLAVKPGEGNPITQDLLLADHEDVNDPRNIVYTVLKAPEHGTLFLVNFPLEVGSTFRQESINVGNLRYANDGNSNVDFDSFSFDITGGGGWIGIPQFNIKLDDDAVTNTTEVYNQNGLVLFPNPANATLNLLFEKKIEENLNIRIINIQGQILYNTVQRPGDQQLEISTATLSNGIYFIEIQGREQTFTRKFSVQH